jgi:lysophospholipase L1-like esterase
MTMRHGTTLLTSMIVGAVMMAALPAYPALAMGSPRPVATRVTFTAIGDSLTSQKFQGSQHAWMSWVPSASNSQVSYVKGGYAVGGTTTADQLARVVHVRANVLVILTGTNDINRDLSPDDAIANIVAIAAIAGAPHVLLVALAPTNNRPAEAMAYNSQLVDLAIKRGWSFIDPWTPYRTPSGTWRTGANWDAFHPNKATAHAVGLKLRPAIAAAVNPLTFAPRNVPLSTVGMTVGR